ncbi:MAG: DUF2341 domain-containing protein, partial [Sphingobacteriales bacterium]
RNSLCNYWIESFDNNGTSVIWVKVPTTGSWLTMYYGNATAPATSDGSGVFDYFEDFKTDFTGRWVKAENGGTVTQDISGAGTVKIDLTGTSGLRASISNSTPFPTASPSFFMETKHREGGYHRIRYYASAAPHTSASATASTSLGFDYGYFRSGATTDRSRIFWSSASAADLMNINTDYLTRWKITDGSSFEWSTLLMSNYSLVEAPKVTNAAQTFRHLTVQVTEQANTSTTVDWVRVRKSQATDPVVSVGGATAYPQLVRIDNTGGATVACPNTNITINGTNLSAATSVTIGGVNATIVSNTATQIVATVGNGSSGNIVVSTASGISNAYPFLVNQLPVVAAITGSLNVCVGNAVPFSNLTTGGTWSVSNGTGSASISSTGVLTGISAGTVIVSYNFSNGICVNPVSLTVNINAPSTLAPIAGGSTEVCVNGTSLPFTHPVPGGIWSISNGSGSATVSPAGVVTGLTAGTATLIY